ncbi:CASC3/Barentsz eIF4AIII binding [Abeliophyllum distichum]|uniref:CASC3/Barentsz eIF4AIII binding n=1 Tax=Abeliophyllum distichum TaxID=126358 RepID=A0ABD1VPU1_9LAMI
MAEEYESDPEEAKLSLKLRRREASDDEEEAEMGEGKEHGEKPRRSVESDSESDGQGGAAEYEDELEEEEEREYYGEDDEYAEEEEEEVEYEERGGSAGESVEVKGGVEGDITEEERRVKNDVDEIRNDNNINDGQQEEEEKKVIEPYAVPTAGAFYMHDDRFRDNAGGRNRRTLGGRKLWESKDDRKWGHDKFEELTIQERHYEERRRTSRGRHRGRGRNRAADLGYAREHRPKAYNNNNIQNSDNNHSNAPKGVRGRGPRRYQPAFRSNNEAPRAQNKQSGKSIEKPSHVSSGRTGAHVSKVESDANPPRKQVFASNLSITSPPFYPSGSSTKETSMPQRGGVQAGTINRNVQSSTADESFPIAQSSTLLQGKDIVDSIGMNKLYIDGSLSTVTGKPSNALQMLPSSSSSINSTQPLPQRGQGRGAKSSAQMAYKPVVSSQVNRGPQPTKLQTVQRNPVQSRVQSSGQQFVQHLGGGSQTSPQKAVAINSFEPVELESPSDSSKSKTALVAKGKGSVQGGGRGSFLYSGAQVMGAPGNVGGGNGDQNFPAFLPVMQFGGQHPGGIGVPAVGMAFPGYVAQPQHGLGNSEMTWLPVLAGAAGALGTTFGSPYISLDGSYHARPSGQTSSVAAASSKDNNTTTVDNDGKPTHRPELANDDFGQRQKNPRRYTEMKFDQ